MSEKIRATLAEDLETERVARVKAEEGLRHTTAAAEEQKVASSRRTASLETRVGELELKGETDRAASERASVQMWEE